MCIPHGGGGRTDSGYIDIKPKKSIKRVSQDEFEKGDPDFIDERTSKYEKPKEKMSLMDCILGKK